MTIVSPDVSPAALSVASSVALTIFPAHFWSGAGEEAIPMLHFNGDSNDSIGIRDPSRSGTRARSLISLMRDTTKKELGQIEALGARRKNCKKKKREKKKENNLCRFNSKMVSFLEPSEFTRLMMIGEQD